MFRLLLVPCFLGVALLSAQAQTISPIISEYRQSADGSFQVRNETLAPFAVVLEVRSFTVNDDGDPLYRPLDSGVIVELSSKSFRVPPHRAFTVFYRAHSAKLPAWFTIYANIQGRPAAPGLQLLIRLPHTVYLLTKSAPSRSEIVLSSAQPDLAQHKVRFILQNNSSQFDRVQSVELRSPAGKQTYGGFPCFPHQKRIITLDWNKQADPAQLTLAFSKFKLDADFPRPASSP
jgi:hypothetical protein